jgi:general stress protein YciG
MLSVFSASSSLPLASPPPQRASISFAGSIKGRIPPAMMKSAFVSPIKAARSQRCFSGRTTGVLRIAKPSPRLSPSPAMFPGSPCLLLTEAEAEKAQGFEAVPCKPAEYSTTRAANSAAISVALQRGLPPPTPLQSQDTMSSARDGGAGVYAPSSQGTTVKPSLGGDQAQDKERLQAAGRRAGLKARTVLLLYRKQARRAPRSAPQSRPSSAPPPSLILVDAGGAANDAAFAAPRAAPASKKPGVALYGNAEAEHRASLKVRAALLARARQDATKQPSWVSAHAGLGLALWR